MTEFVVVCNPDNRRYSMFAAAAQAAGAHVRPVTWRDVLAGGLPPISPTSICRLESFGEDAEVSRLLMRRGAARLGVTPPNGVQHGQIAGGRLEALGFSDLLAGLDGLDVRWMNSPASVAAMFDKAETSERLTREGVAVPRRFGRARSGDEVLSLVRASETTRAFVKPRYSSSASGVVALRASAHRLQATTSVELVAAGDGDRAFNSLRVRTYRDADVERLLDALGPEELLVEEWIPKASWSERVFDLRVLVVAGHARHVVVRASRTPLTNLHLGNERGDVAEVRRAVGDDGWRSMLQTCERAVGCFPGASYAGVDVAFTAGFGGHHVLEVNAFGDLLPDVTDLGETTYAAEVRATLQAQEASASGP